MINLLSLYFGSVMCNARSSLSETKVRTVSGDEFFPDYHEHNDFQPAMLALSHFVIQWNWAEHSFNVVLWQYTGDFDIGSMYTAGLGNQSRVDALLALARRREKNPKVLELTEFAAKAFGRIKGNRNSLVHAHSVSLSPEDDKPRWIRGSNNPKNIHIYCLADYADIIENLNASCQLAKLLEDLIVYHAAPGNPIPTSEPFTLPKALNPIPISREEQGSPSDPPEK